MLELIRYKSLNEKNKFIESIDFNSVTLLVPDLSSKLYWQEFLIKKNGFVSGPQVLRAEDFWKIILQRALPEFNFVTKSWMTTYLKSILTKDLLETIGLPYAKINTVFNAMNEFLPILAHPDSKEIMDHWFDDVQLNQCSWKQWFSLSVVLWEQIKAKKAILPSWSSSFLIQNQDFENYWNREILVDLGPELRSVEVELLQSLSKRFKIQILTPHQKWIDEFKWIDYPYKQFLIRDHKSIDLVLEQESTLTSSETLLAPSVQIFKRFSSTLGEVKFVVGQIQDWLKLGKNFSEMAIVAPDIEDYWPILSVHLKKESYHFEKNIKSKMGSVGSVLAWLSFLKRKVFQTIAYEDLQLAEFHPINKSSLRFESIQTQWTLKPILNPSHVDLDISITAHDFMKWAIQIWPQSNLLPKFIIEECKTWLMEADSLGENKISIWIEYLEDYLKNQEIDISPGSCEGIGVYSLMSGIPSHKKMQIFLGCSESQLKSPRGLVSGSDVLSLHHHTGHLLAHPDRDFKEYQLRALLGQCEIQIFTFPETNFSGAELVPSVFWMKGRENEYKVKKIPTMNYHQLDHWNVGMWENNLLSRANSELITRPGENQKINHQHTFSLSFSLSPASLTSYVECPFKFYAEKALRLNDPIIVDLDLDARTNGSLQHKLLELLLKEPVDFVNRKSELNEIVEKTLVDQNENFFSEKTKELARQQLFQLGSRFLDYEQTYRREFPRFYTFASEAWFQRTFYINDKNIMFRGKIDRIDLSTDKSEAIVIDYKNDSKSYSHASNWIKNLEFQMPAYVQALESGAVKNGPGPTPVVAAHYYGLKDFSRKGFTLDEVKPGIVSSLSSTGTLDKDEKNKIIEEFQFILEDSARKILEGDFRAIPHPKTDCNQCRWRNLCRTSQPNL